MKNTASNPGPVWQPITCVKSVTIGSTFKEYFKLFANSCASSKHSACEIIT